MSDETKFTPGPWVVVTNSNEIPCIVQCAEHRVASAYFNGRDDGAPPNKATAEANAHLIAASPNMFTALTPFADIDGEGDEDYPDDTPVTITFGRCTHYLVTLGDLRRARRARDLADGWIDPV